MTSLHHSSPIRLIARDLIIITVSILVAIAIVKSGAVHALITYARDFQYIGTFISGMFFTSVFTTAPAIVALGEFAQTGSIITTALLGAAGAVIGDLLIFKFVRDELSNHIADMKFAHPSKRFKKLFENRWFRWVPFFLGGLVIASPLPDELGVSLMGISHANTRTFMAFSFCFNFSGIILIGLVARAV